MNAVQAALYSKLANNAALMARASGGVHYRIAPLATTCPFIVFSQQSHVPLGYGLSGQRTADNLVYLVKVVDRGESNQHAAAITADIDALLDNGTLTVPGYRSVWLRTINAGIEYDEMAADGLYQHVGAEYRVIIVKQGV